MLNVQLDKARGIAVFEPDGPLSESDFASAVSIINPWIEKNGNLNGLIIRTKSFPGWESFSAIATHLRFVHDHHKQISRIAFVTDSLLGKLAEKFARHFVKPEIRKFPYSDIQAAQDWVSGGMP